MRPSTSVYESVQQQALRPYAEMIRLAHLEATADLSNKDLCLHIEGSYARLAEQLREHAGVLNHLAGVCDSAAAEYHGRRQS